MPSRPDTVRVVIDSKGVHTDVSPPTSAEQADIEARFKQHVSELEERTKVLTDRESAENVVRDAAKSDPIIAAIAKLLGVE